MHLSVVRQAQSDSIDQQVFQTSWPSGGEYKSVTPKTKDIGYYTWMNNDELALENLPFELQQASTSPKQLSAFDLASAEKIHIQKVLNYTNGNKTETAKLLNIALTTLYRKLEEYKL